jgi:rRNA maturation endonuclease Nob1
MPVEIKRGQVHPIVIRWGNQVRLQCAQCKRMIPNGIETECSRCGTKYKRKNADEYRVVEVG